MHLSSSALTALAVAGVLAAGALVGGCSSTSALALKEGDCFLYPDEGDTEISDVTTKACTEEHDAEIIGVTTVDGDEMPQSDALDAQAQDDCLAAFQDYVGTAYEDSTLGLTWLVPTQDSWDKADDREIVCVALTSDGSSLTSSVKDSRL
jgi:hypothetical protein